MFETCTSVGSHGEKNLFKEHIFLSFAWPLWDLLSSEYTIKYIFSVKISIKVSLSKLRRIKSFSLQIAFSIFEYLTSACYGHIYIEARPSHRIFSSIRFVESIQFCFVVVSPDRCSRRTWRRFKIFIRLSHNGGFDSAFSQTYCRLFSAFLYS